MADRILDGRVAVVTGAGQQEVTVSQFVAQLGSFLLT